MWTLTKHRAWILSVENYWFETLIFACETGFVGFGGSHCHVTRALLIALQWGPWGLELRPPARQLFEWPISEADLPALVKPWDEWSPSPHLDYILMRDPENHPAKPPEFQTWRNWEVTDAYCVKPLSFGVIRYVARVILYSSCHPNPVPTL